MKIIYNYKILKKYNLAGCYYCGEIMSTEGMVRTEEYGDDSVDCPCCDQQALIPLASEDINMNKLNLMMLLGILESVEKMIEIGE
jgi:hypothetical protein